MLGLVGVLLGWVCFGLGELGFYFFYYGIYVGNYLVVCESDDFKAKFIKPCGSFCILFLLVVMNFAIGFNNKALT